MTATGEAWIDGMSRVFAHLELHDLTNSCCRWVAMTAVERMLKSGRADRPFLVDDKR